MHRKRNELMLKGLPDVATLVAQGVDVEGSAHPQFEQRWKRPERPLANGRKQIFFDEFYGESVELGAAQEHTIDSNDGDSDLLFF